MSRDCGEEREIESFLHCGNSALPRKCFFERKGGGGAPRKRKSKNYEIALCFIAIARALASCRVVIRLTFSPVFFTPSPLFLELQSVIFAAYSLILIFPIPSLTLAIVWNWFTEKMEYSNVKTGKLNLKGEKKKKKKKKRTHDEMEAGWVWMRRCVGKVSMRAILGFSWLGPDTLYWYLKFHVCACRLA